MNDWEAKDDIDCVMAFIEKNEARFYEFAESWFMEYLEEQEEQGGEFNEDR